MYRQDQLKPKDTRYIHRFVTNGEAGNIIVTTIQELIALLDGDAVKSFEADTTFKRVAGSFNEWEVSLFYKPLNRAITIARVYVDRASTNFFERVFDELRAVKLELTGKPIAFKALAPNGHILAFNSDMDSAQVLAAARSFLKDNNVEYSGIDANMPPEKFAPRTIKLCVMHAKRAILDFRGLVPEHDFHHLFKFGEHIHSEETLQQFSDFVRRLNGKKIQDWWDHKAVSAWIFPCLVRSLSPMTDIDWESTPSTTNIGESQHHWTNTQTSTKLSLVEAIETARIVDFRVVDDIHLALNSGVLVNPYNHAAHRATKNMARHASTSPLDQEIAEAKRMQKEAGKTKGKGKPARVLAGNSSSGRVRSTAACLAAIATPPDVVTSPSMALREQTRVVAQAVIPATW
ncbi:hypothetical protein MKEN_00995600 [Mycena kentingensis (nom. inval.)]|nr:hypothetical protein MKEN_00995600 [Mycena kentingensis (nom. inval.)]